MGECRRRDSSMTCCVYCSLWMSSAFGNAAFERGHFRVEPGAHRGMVRQRPVDPAQAGGRGLVAGEEHGRQLVAQRLVVEEVSFFARGAHDAREHAAAFVVRGAMLLHETEQAIVEALDGRIEQRDLLRVRLHERRDEIARLRRPVALHVRGDVAELVRDFGEGFAQQEAAGQQLRQAVEVRLHVEGGAAHQQCTFQRSRKRSVCSPIHATCASSVSGLNAGCVITRWRRHSAASESSRP